MHFEGIGKGEMEQVKRKIRRMVSHRKGYRGIASAWDSEGNPIIRVDIDVSAHPSTYKDIPNKVQGISIKIRQIKGTIRLQGS